MTLQEIFEKAEIETRSYSGRGMYGAQCLAVAVDDLGALFSAVVESIRSKGPEAHDVVSKAFQGMNTDQLGRGLIVYFPSIPWE